MKYWRQITVTLKAPLSAVSLGAVLLPLLALGPEASALEPYFAGVPLSSVQQACETVDTVFRSDGVLCASLYDVAKGTVCSNWPVNVKLTHLDKLIDRASRRDCLLESPY